MESKADSQLSEWQRGDAGSDGPAPEYASDFEALAVEQIAEFTGAPLLDARTSFRDAGGDVNLAIARMNHMSIPGVGLPEMTRSVSDELMEFAGINRDDARRVLAQSGDLEAAKRRLLRDVLGSSCIGSPEAQSRQKGVVANIEPDSEARTSLLKRSTFGETNFGVDRTRADGKSENRCRGEEMSRKNQLREWPKTARENQPSNLSMLPHVECPICFTVTPTGKAMFLECGHTFCLSCFRRCIQAQIESGNAADVACPLPTSQCGRRIDQRELRAALGDEAFARLDRHALDSATAADPTLHHCPTPDCPFIVCWAGDGPPLCDCPVCKKTSCLQCASRPYHVGLTCADHKRVTRSGGDDELTKEYLRKSKIRTCGRCGAGVIKSEGCDKMKCRCGYRFCYVCGAENARCGHTPDNHGYVDPITGRVDFSNG